MRSIALPAIVVLGLLVLAPAAGEAGDQPEHRHMIYALGVAAGFTPAEAKVIADGSWAITDPAHATRLLSDDRVLDAEIFSPRGGLARIGPAALMHSLGLFYGGMIHLETQHGDETHLRHAAGRFLRLTNVDFRSGGCGSSGWTGRRRARSAPTSRGRAPGPHAPEPAADAPAPSAGLARRRRRRPTGP